MSSSNTTRKQREIQKEVEAAEGRGKPKQRGAMQAGARDYPEPPFPGVHQDKPGSEADLPLAPMYDAPFYKGSGKLKGKVALVSGGDLGIGRSVAVLFAREGADVAIVHLKEPRDANETKTAIEKEGCKCIPIPGDDPSFCRKAVDKTVAALGQLDMLVNNAAFQVHTVDIADLSDEHFDETLKTNLYGYFYMAKAAIPRLTKGSAIANTGSVTDIEGSKEPLDYSMTKGGIHAFTRALASQLVPKGIRVNAVALGPVWTPLNPSDKNSEDVEKFGALTPMKRAAQPEEIAPAYVFLASPQTSSYITGEILPIVGGY